MQVKKETPGPDCWSIDAGSWTSVRHHLGIETSNIFQAKIREGSSTHASPGGALVYLPFDKVSLGFSHLGIETSNIFQAKIGAELSMFASSEGALVSISFDKVSLFSFSHEMPARWLLRGRR